MEQKSIPSRAAVDAAPRPLAALLTNLAPRRWPGEYVFDSVADIDAINPAEHVAILHEAEGWTLVTERSTAGCQDRPGRESYTAITLEVDSDLGDVGLTAAVSQVLADAGIACNILAGVHHDHLFVPIADADRALALLVELQRAHRPTSRPIDPT